MRIRTFTALLLLTAASSLSAGHYADLYVIPVASHTAGAGGTMWQSDVAIQNFQSVPLTVQLIFIESGEGNPNNVMPLTLSNGKSEVTVPAGGSVRLNDILNGFGGKNEIAGSIVVAADLPFAVTSRSYNNDPRGTYGQSVLPARDFIDSSLGDTNNALAIAYLPGLVSNARYRANLGFVGGTANTANAMTVEFTLRDAAGASLGQRTFTVPSGAFVHVQFPVSSISTTQFDAGAAEVRILSGDGAVVPYASVIDNQGGDAVYVSGVMPSNAPAGKRGSSSLFQLLVTRR